MFETYRTVEGDTVDLIAFRRFGRQGAESAILEANPYLAALGPVLPANIEVWIPVPEVKDRTTSSRIWD